MNDQNSRDLEKSQNQNSSTGIFFKFQFSNIRTGDTVRQIYFSLNIFKKNEINFNHSPENVRKSQFA